MPKETKKENISDVSDAKSKEEKKFLFIDKIKNFFSLFFKKINKKNKNKKIDHLQLLESDLIKDEVPVVFEFRKHLMAFFALLLVSFIFIMEFYFFLSWWESKKSEENSTYLQNEINEVISEKRELEDKYSLAVDFTRRMDVSFSVLDKHIYWSNFFLFLEDNTLKNVYFKNFSGDIGGSYVLPAVTDDVRAVSYQSRYFSSDRRTNNVSISDEQIGEGGLSSSSGLVDFNINLTLNSRVFNDL